MLGDDFDKVYAHHQSISALWNLEWKSACQRSTYPFHDGRFEDFEPVFQTLIREGVHDGYTAEFCKAFIPTARRLVAEADTAVAAGDKTSATALYLRACAVYRIARFPYISGTAKRAAYEAQKFAYMKEYSTSDSERQRR